LTQADPNGYIAQSPFTNGEAVTILSLLPYLQRLPKLREVVIQLQPQIAALGESLRATQSYLDELAQGRAPEQADLQQVWTAFEQLGQQVEELRAITLAVPDKPKRTRAPKAEAAPAIPLTPPPEQPAPTQLPPTAPVVQPPVATMPPAAPVVTQPAVQQVAPPQVQQETPQSTPVGQPYPLTGEQMANLAAKEAADPNQISAIRNEMAALGIGAEL
jgi:hypothetical protein